jgi:hypothetical protein
MSWIETGTEGTPSYLVYLLLAASIALGLAFPLLRRRRASAPAPDDSRARAELERLLTEIQDLSREHIARLDTKIRLLNQLLLDCDRKQRELEAFLARAASGPSAPARPANPLHDQVYSLHDGGKNLLEICEATGLEKGEVELILGLRKMSA